MSLFLKASIKRECDLTHKIGTEHLERCKIAEFLGLFVFPTFHSDSHDTQVFPPQRACGRRAPSHLRILAFRIRRELPRARLSAECPQCPLEEILPQR